MDFNDIIGYEKIKGYLTESVDAGRIPHAQLFAAAEGQEINRSKEILSYEVTKIVHGEQEAQKAQETAKALFSGGMSAELPQIHAAVGEKLVDVLTQGNVFASKGEARRLIQQGGLTLNDVRITDEHYVLQETDFPEGSALIKKGKKKHYRLVY